MTTPKRLTEIVPQKAIVDGTLLVTVIRETADGAYVVETGHGSLIVDKTRLQLIA
jgi:hypothetical protein